MSIYDYREKPAYGLFKTKPQDAENPNILKWWNSTLDKALVMQISRWQWVWYWGIKDEILKLTTTETIEKWRKSDPLCSKNAWYNVLMYFAAARAEQLGFTKSIRQPKNKICPLCNNVFIEDSLPMPIVERLGIDRLNFCAPCIRDIILFGTGNDATPEKEILNYIQNLASLLGRVPPQNFGRNMADLLDLSDDERLALLKLLRNKPSVERVKSLFGSWLNALIQAGILEDGTRKTGRGIQCIAKDGHVCLSLGEKTIDDYLHAHGIYHKKEPRYPEYNYRGDFIVGTVIIEYFGLTGNPEYDAKTKEKIRLCEKRSIKLVALYPEDLISQKRLENKLSVFSQNSEENPKKERA